MKKLISLLLLLATTVRGVDYYVRLDGTNSNSGTADSAAGAWRNFYYAANGGVSGVTAGDHVHLGPGWFNEFATNTTSGTAGNLITFSGTRGENGEWLTIIDPSTSLSNGWVSVGSGIYSNVAPFHVAEMTIDGKRVGYCWTNGPLSDIASAYTDSGWVTGLDLLGVATGATVVSPLNATTTTYWDGIEALYTSSNTVCWLRLRDSSDPNGLPIRVAPNADAYDQNMHKPTINAAANYLVFSNLCVRGGFGQISFAGANAVTAVSNRLSTGYIKIYAGGMDNSTIRNNVITTDWYGGNEMGAWGSGDSSIYDQHLNQYLVGKFHMGHSAQNDFGVCLSGGNSLSNTITGNQFINILNDAIVIGETAWWTWINGNVFSNVSAHSIMMYEEQTNTYIFDNAFWDANIHIRLGTFNAEVDVRTNLFVYRNTLQNPTDVGDHFYFHGNPGAGKTTTNKVLWVYHNSFSGGRMSLMISGDLPANGGGLYDCHFINNIFSGEYYGNVSWDGITNAWVIKDFDYNLLMPPQPSYPTSDDPAWLGVNNTKTSTNLWTNAEGMSFALTANSQAIGAAIDTSSAFTLDSVEYPALPDTATKVGATWDIGALEYSEAEPPAAESRVIRAGTLVVRP